MFKRWVNAYGDAKVSKNVLKKFSYVAVALFLQLSSIKTYINTYMHTCINTSKTAVIHTYTQTYIHTYTVVYKEYLSDWGIVYKKLSYLHTCTDAYSDFLPDLGKII